jgi:RimJ/RimL family protein N-acetyltransferase
LVHIDYRSRKAEWGRFLIGDPSARGKGLAVEALYLSLRYAFFHLNLRRIYLEAYAWNEAARSLYDKFGFKVEGTYRAHIYREGNYHDIVIYGLLESEFREKEERIRQMVLAQDRGP